MSGLFSKPKTPSPPKEVQRVEEIQRVEEDGNDVSRRAKRKHILSSGKQSTILTGIQAQLKKRLGE